MRKMGIVVILAMFYSTSALSSSYDLPFVEKETYAKIKAINIHGADAKVMFEFIKKESPAKVTKGGGGTLSYEHIQGKGIFCVKDTRKLTAKRTSISYRCDFTVSGSGTLNPVIQTDDNDNGCGGCGAGGGDGP